MRPGLLALELGNPFDEQGEDTELHVSFDALGQPGYIGSILIRVLLRVLKAL